jgi:hypothetical protein
VQVLPFLLLLLLLLSRERVKGRDDARHLLIRIHAISETLT